jgi:hypothetical protein
MERQLCFLGCGVIAFLPLLAQTPAEKQRAPAVSMDREIAIREQPISITAQVAPDAELKDVKVWLDDNPVEVQAYQDKSARFSLPESFPLGEYQVYLWVGQKGFYAGKLTVAASLTDAPTKVEVQPLVTYIGAGTAWRDMLGAGRGRWTIFGTGFANKTPSDISLLVNRSEHKLNWVSTCDLSKIPGELANKGQRFDDRAVYGVAKSSRELEVCNVPVEHQGVLSLSIRQGSAEPPAVTVRATKWPHWLVLLLTILVTGFLAAVVYLLVSFKGAHIIRGSSYRLRALLLDKQTNTYSLSILQFLMWTATALFGYTYLALSKLFVQRLDIIPDVPDVLPGIIGVGLGAGTAIASQAIGQVRPKGSGDEVPSPSDLVTSGGAVAPDRIQMLVWTIVGIGVFLCGVLKQNPVSIDGLPMVPNTLMALMGLGSIGYLGAKFARKPGPNILELSVIPAHARTAGGPLAVQPPVNIAQPVAEATQVLQSVKAAAAGLSESSAPVAVRAANGAIGALQASVAAASALQISGGGAESVPKLAELMSTSYEAAEKAAQEFERIAGTAGAEMARVSASIAQRAAAAVEELAASTGEAVSLTGAAETIRAQRSAKEFRRVVELRGQNLSPEGIFRARVGAEEYDIPFRMLEMKDNRRTPEVVVRDESNPAFARTIRLTIVPSLLEPADRATYDKVFGQATQEITFTIFNPDGQKAAKTFALPPGEAQRQ